MMNKRAKQPPVPSERHETVRQEIIDVLKGQTLTAKDISALVRIPEKSVYEHLEHIQKSMARSEHPLAVVPAQCKKCGFTFKKRERLKKPGRCPACKGEAIEEPLFTIPEGQNPEAGIKAQRKRIKRFYRFLIYLSFYSDFRLLNSGC